MAHVAAAGTITAVLSPTLWPSVAAAQEDKGVPRASDVILEDKTCADCHTALVSIKHMHTPAEQDSENYHESNGKRHPTSLR